VSNFSYLHKLPNSFQSKEPSVPAEESLPASEMSYLVVRNPDQALIGAVPSSGRGPKRLEASTDGTTSHYTSRAAAVLVRDLQYRRRNQEPPSTSLEIPWIECLILIPNMISSLLVEGFRTWAASQQPNYTVETLSASAFDKNYPRPRQGPGSDVSHPVV